MLIEMLVWEWCKDRHCSALERQTDLLRPTQLCGSPFRGSRRRWPVWVCSGRGDSASRLIIQFFPATIWAEPPSRRARQCLSFHSPPTNIAQGCGRNTNTELARFIDIAIGSASEVEYHLLLARDLGYLPENRHMNLATEVIEIRRTLLTLNKKLRS